MKLKNVKVGQLVKVKSEEEVLKKKGSKINKHGWIATKNGDLYLPEVEGALAGEVFRVEEINIDGFYLENCECEIGAAFLTIATKEDIDSSVGTLKNDLIEEFNELVNQNNPTLNRLVALTNKSQEALLIEVMQEIIQKLTLENQKN